VRPGFAGAPTSSRRFSSLLAVLRFRLACLSAWRLRLACLRCRFPFPPALLAFCPLVSSRGDLMYCYICEFNAGNASNCPNCGAELFTEEQITEICIEIKTDENLRRKEGTKE